MRKEIPPVGCEDEFAGTQAKTPLRDTDRDRVQTECRLRQRARAYRVRALCVPMRIGLQVSGEQAHLIR